MLNGLVDPAVFHLRARSGTPFRSKTYLFLECAAIRGWNGWRAVDGASPRTALIHKTWNTTVVPLRLPAREACYYSRGQVVTSRGGCVVERLVDPDGQRR